MSYVKFFKDITVDDLGLVGGKGLSLGRMSNADLPVPAGFVITTNLHKDFKSSGQLSQATEQELLAAFDSLDASRVAVRSSAISEDSETASWAGQFESYLNVSRSELIQRVKDCWGSVKNAAAYAKTQDLKEAELVLGVVVQKMVDSEVSGVAFSVNPISHLKEEIMIEATYGLCELLVQGMVTPDNYVVTKPNGDLVSRSIVSKTKQLTYQDGQTKEVPVDPGEQDQPTLTSSQLSELATLVCRIEDYYLKPQDIEWALQHNNFYIVQSRPITTN
ncbi:MAG: PEP/pyruvate-binding domain-containing protein [Candidatus Saccharimonadales bacterium]